MNINSSSAVTSTNTSIKTTYGKSTHKHGSTFLESNFDSLMSNYSNHYIKSEITNSNLTTFKTTKHTNSPNNESKKLRKVQKNSTQSSSIRPNNTIASKNIQKRSITLPSMKSNNPFDTKVKNTPTKFLNSYNKPPMPILITSESLSADFFGFPDTDSDTEAGPIGQQILSSRKKRNRTDIKLSPPLELPIQIGPPKLKSPKQDKNKQPKLLKTKQKLQDSRSPKRPKEQLTATTSVELFDIKQPHQCRELGQQQMFRDEVQYLLDGIKPAQPVSTRCLAQCSLAAECFSPLFRRQLSFHQLMPQLIQSLSDAPTSPPPLRLAAALLLYALSRDRSSTELDSDTIKVILQLTKDYGHIQVNQSTQCSSMQQSEYIRATKTTESRVTDILFSLEPTESHPLPPKGPIIYQLLALMTLQSLISLQKEEFCQQLAELGALDYITTFIASSIDAAIRIQHTTSNGEYTESKSPDKYSRFKQFGKIKTEVSLESQSNLHLFSLSTSLLTLNSLTKKYPPSLHQLGEISTVQLPNLFFRCIELNRDCLLADSNCIVAYECLKQGMLSITELCNEVETFSRSIYESAEFLTSLVDCVLTLAPSYISEYQFDIQIIGLMALINHLAKSNAACESFLQLSSTNGDMLFKQFINLYIAKQKEADILTQELSQVISRIKLSNSPPVKVIKLTEDNLSAESDTSKYSSFSTSQLDKLSMLDDDNSRHLKVSFPIEYFNSKLTHDCSFDSIYSVEQLDIPTTQPEADNMAMSAKEMSDFIREAATSEEVKGKATANFESSIIAAMTSLLVGLIASKNSKAQSLLSQRMGIDDFEKMATLLHQMLSFYNLVCDSPLAREKTTQLASDVLRFFTSYL
ncbi:Protein wings apart-like protein [Oopsacas minuta]|uniref:Protein wings apart-like protein n=1 Tax=Oopsacas minuta TaxID=111878 RepID=A0AAV7JBA0_9METZ|nr:Protein wings apart-like protein [Oopsacas minuta]